ncbi:MAG TPA: sugar ABC transporter ATP-binding protein [Clostridia bacterium]|nr:sugar ABC transporter ATP-binding protein [Clostridia bacterium]
MAEEKYVLEVINISKSFPGVKALDKVNLRIRKGTVHALMGENGAGKSTLMKTLAGINQPDEGEIVLNGKPVKFDNPRESMKSGIAMIHQELSPVLEMTIAENLFLGREFHYNGNIVVNYPKMNSEARKMLEKVGLNINPTLKMKSLTVAQSQMVEIAKAIGRESEIIIMDEPTSAITTREVDTLFKLIEKLKSTGHSIIYITHKMDEVFRIADEITVFRDGKHVGTYPAAELDTDALIRLMVNRELTEIFPEKNGEIKDVKLSVKNLTRKKAFENVSFDVREGEILGLAGLMGAGRTEVVEGIFGVTKLDCGEIFIDGKKAKIRAPSDAIKLKIGLVTEDRKLSGLVLPLCIKENMTLPSLKNLSRFSIVDRKKETAKTLEMANSLKVKTPSIKQLVQNLSGGNQQKVVLAKWLLTAPQILIFDEPTRGIDVGAKADIYHLVMKLAEEGKTVIFISSEMQEILGMCDRIIVFHEGRISGELTKKEATQEKILKLATGMN